MKIKCTLLTFLLIPLLAHSQWNNLITNNSIEDVDFVVWSSLCQTDQYEHGQLDPSFCNLPNSKDNNLYREYWDQITAWNVPADKEFVISPYIGTPDLFSSELTDPSVGLPRSGTKWISTSAEYVVIELEEELESGVTYFIEFFCDVTDAGPCTVSAYNRFPRHWNASSRTLEQNNSLYYETIMAFDNTGFTDWTRMATFFTVTENRKWLSLGGHGDFDDIKIYKVPDLCRNEWYFDNTVFNYPLEIFQAGDFIKAGYGVDPEDGQLDGPVTVLAGTHLIFRAGNEAMKFIWNPVLK